MKKLAIFDFDGTIMDSVNDVVLCLNKALTIHNFPTLTREEVIGSLGGDIDDIISLVLRDEDTPENIEMVKKTYLGIYYPSKKELSVPFPKSVEFLKELENRGIMIAINSNRFTDSIETFIVRFFRDINFISVRGHDYDCPSKPDPCGINKIVKKAGVTLEDTIYIGDSNTDIQTAKNAKIDCVVVKWGYGSQKDWENDYILECVDEFSQLLKYF